MKCIKVLFSVSIVISAVRAFSDTAPLYYFPAEAGMKGAASSSASDSAPFEPHYIAEASDILAQIEMFSRDICRGNGHLVVYRVHRLVASHVDSISIRNVHYSSVKLTSLSFDKSCSVSGENPQISIVEINDDKDHSIMEFSSKHDSHVLVQGIPPFHSAIQDVKDYVKEKFDIEVFHKRQVSPELESLDSVQLAELTKEVEQELEAAEELVLLEIDASEIGSLKFGLNTSLVNRNSNLFTNYQFFTPGIWMCAIVSGLMIGILYVALGWISSVEISYGAFEKQVDWQKKNE